MSRVSHGLDRVMVRFDDPNLVANAGLVLVGTLVIRLELERLVDSLVRLTGRVGGARPGREAPGVQWRACCPGRVPVGWGW